MKRLGCKLESFSVTEEVGNIRYYRIEELFFPWEDLSLKDCNLLWKGEFFVDFWDSSNHILQTEKGVLQESSDQSGAILQVLRQQS